MAAFRIVGMMWVSMVAGPVIQVTVPDAIRPAMASMVLPEGGHQHRGAGASIWSGPKVEARRVSPAKLTCSPSSRGIRTDRYSRMCRAGLSNDWPNTFSMTTWWERPIPKVRRPPVAAWTVNAWAASITGWRG